MNWQRHAACATVDPDLFFTVGRPKPAAREACNGCRVVVACFFDAMRNPGDGFRAGMTARDREALLRWDRKQHRRAEAQQRRQAQPP